MSFLCKRCSKYLFIHHEWSFSCFLNWNGKANALWHIWHSKTLGLSPWVLARWYLRWFFWTNFFPQWLQLCWREGAWINRCSFKLRNSPKFLSQIVQVHGLSPEWVVLMWYFNLVLSLNTLLHALHFLLTVSHTLEISWFCNNFWLKKFFRQILHENWFLDLDLFLCIFLSFWMKAVVFVFVMFSDIGVFWYQGHLPLSSILLGCRKMTYELINANSW